MDAAIDMQSFDWWDLEMPVIPPRSRLYGLPPIGLGNLMRRESDRVSSEAFRGAWSAFEKAGTT
jgi:hypothetical protein